MTIAAACGKKGAGFPTESASARVVSSPGDGSRKSEDAPTSIEPCDTTPAAICYRDTAHAGDDKSDPAGYPLAAWLLFAAAGDSIEIWAPPGGAVSTDLGKERDSLHNTAPYFRHRFQYAGTLGFDVSLDETQGETAPYTLRITRVASSSAGSLRPSGQTATLAVASHRRATVFSLVPLSVAPTVRDRSRWRIFPRRYKVALVSDSLYELCPLPCSAPDTVKLTPGANVVKKY